MIKGKSVKKIYSVEEAIWLAAALFAYEQYTLKDEVDITDFCIEAPELQKIAQRFTEKTVQLARIYQHNNGDHDSCSHRSIRRLEKYNGHPAFRVTATGEFGGDKEYPHSLEFDNEIEFNGTVYTIDEIKSFVDKEYSDIIRKNTSMIKNSVAIDYLGILEYLEKNKGIPYKDPNKLGLSDEERNKYLEVKSNGQKVVAELKKIHELCSNKFNLEKCEKISWDDGSHTKTKSYLWVPMKYAKYGERQESISIFVELEDEKTAGYRVSLELKNSKATASDVQTYHKHLELPLNKDAQLVYVAGSNELGRPDIIDEAQSIIIEKVKTKEYSKVQVCRRIGKSEFQTNNEIQEEIFKSVEAIIPYYNYVLGINKEEDVKEALENMDLLNDNIIASDTENMEFDKNIILYGPPGTGKTYNSVIYAVAICGEDGTLEEVEKKAEEDYVAVKNRYEQLREQGRIAFTTFHQSYGYEEFIEGIKPITVDGNVTYDVVPGIFKAFCDNASKENAKEETNDKNFVFIIDEINRGNISKIFGELITLIEGTKRAGMDETASAILPYSEEAFSVPSNVYILGTMNTADRSIALMDTALRRRFQFVEMMPKSDVLEGIEVQGLNVSKMLDVMNERIKFLYDREHMIGHAFFTGLRKEPTVKKLASIFEKSIIPLLQEYFYEDYQKIQLVLGDNGKGDDEAELKFIKDTKVVTKDIFVGSVEDVIDLPEKKYDINPGALLKIESYKKIGPGL